MADRPGLVGFRIAAIDGAGLDWARLDATWEVAGELGVFDAGWMSDHLSDASRERGGPAMERPSGDLGDAGNWTLIGD